MSVKKEPSGRRSIQVEVEVPGTPEEVWRAIATGPGISTWFVPSEVEEREGGTMVFHFGPGMDAVAKATAWDPPRRFAATSSDAIPGGPPMATEWSVEAKGGGVCVVRVVHSLFASGDDWDDQLESIESGWPAFFAVLRQYLTHFRGQRAATFTAMAMAAAPAPKAWDALTGSLGLAGIAADQRWQTSAAGIELAGLVDRIRGGEHASAVLRLERPAPGMLVLAACPMGAQALLSMAFYLYGESAAAAAAREEPRWQAWMAAQFPPAQDAPA